MKTTIYQFGLLALILLAGCTNDDAISFSNVTGNHSLVATIEGQDMESRSAVDDNGNVTWIEGDEIGVFGTQTQNAKFSTSGSGASVTFKGDLSSGDEQVEWAYYPYDVEASVSGTSLTFTLPSEYTYTGNSNAPMLGVKNGDGENFTFKHLCGLLRITLGGGMPDDADRFVITSEGGDAPSIAGVAHVANIADENAELKISRNNESRSIIYRLGGLSLSDGFQNFFVPMPVGEYSKLTISFYLKGKDQPQFTRTISNLEVRRAVMISMPILDWKTGEQYVLSQNVRDISDGLVGKVSVSSMDPTALTYTGDVAEGELPENGEIVWSRVSEAFPYGFLGKVTNVIKNENGTYTVQTGGASLSEAFDELYINETVALFSENSPKTRGLLHSIFGEKDIAKQLQVKYGNKTNPWFIEGDIGLGAKLTVNIEFDKKNKMEYGAFTLVLNLRLNADAGIDCSFEDEKEIILQKLASISLPNIGLLGGVVQVSPTIEPYFHIKVKGDIKNTIGIETELQGTVVALYKNGEWQSPSNKRETKANNESPWNFKSNLTFSGELFVGLVNEFDLKLYNNEDMRVFFKPEAGLKLEGEIDVNDKNSESLEEILKTAKLNTSFYLAGTIGADASLLSPKGLEAEFEILKYTVWEKEVKLLPFFKELISKVTKDQHVEGSPEFLIAAEVNTEISGELITKDTQISFVIEDEEGNEIKETNPVDYGGGQLEEGTYTTIPVAVSGKFDNLKMDATYSIYPVINSSIIKNYADDGKLRLKNQAVEIKTYSSFEDKLMQIYRSTDGDNWIHKDGWNVDGKVILKRYADGTGTSGYVGGCTNCVPGTVVHAFDLSGNNLNGNVNLKDCPELQMLDISNNVIPNLIIENCKNLTALKCNNTQMENLTVIDCPSLELLECNGNELGGNIQIVNSFILGSRQNSSNNFPRFECSNNSREILDLSQCSQWGKYVNIILAECPNLHSLRIEMSTPFNLDCSSCPQIKNLNLEMPGLAGLTLSKCLNLTELTLKGTNQLSDFRCIDNPNLSTLSISGSASHINRFDCSGCDKLSILNCNHCFWRPGTGLNHITELTLIECYDFRSFDTYDFQKTLKKLVINSSNYNYVHCNLSGYSALIYADLGKFGNFASLENCTSLQTLRFNGGMLRDNIGELKKDCLEELEKCAALKELYLYGGYGEIPVEFKAYNWGTDSYKYEYIYDGLHGAGNPGEYLVNWQYVEHSGWWYSGEPEKGYSGW